MQCAFSCCKGKDVVVVVADFLTSMTEASRGNIIRIWQSKLQHVGKIRHYKDVVRNVAQYSCRNTEIYSRNAAEC